MSAIDYPKLVATIKKKARKDLFGHCGHWFQYPFRFVDYEIWGNNITEMVQFEYFKQKGRHKNDPGAWLEGEIDEVLVYFFPEHSDFIEVKTFGRGRPRGFIPSCYNDHVKWSSYEVKVLRYIKRNALASC